MAQLAGTRQALAPEVGGEEVGHERQAFTRAEDFEFIGVCLAKLDPGARIEPDLPRLRALHSHAKASGMVDY